MSFPFLPDDVKISPEDDLAASIARQLDVPAQAVALPEDQTIPFGRSWEFDFEQGRFVRAGASPIETRGFGALIQWCYMAIHTARLAHKRVFSSQFGMDVPDEPLGEFPEGEILADWQRSLAEALLVHDRISSVENLSLDWDPVEGVLTIESLDVVTDESDQLSLGGVQINIGGMT